MSHGTSFGLSHDNTVSNHGTRSVAAGHKGASHHGHALSARSHSSHLTATHHGHRLNYAFEHNRFTRFSTMTRQVTVTPDVDTPAEKALPPGIELNIDRGKAVPPAIGSKVGPITPDVDTPAEKALPPGIELNVDRGKLPGKETVVPDDDDEQTEPASDDPR